MQICHFKTFSTDTELIAEMAEATEITSSPLILRLLFMRKAIH